MDDVREFVSCRGYSDVPYCPKCNADIPDSEINADCCPYCGCLLDWRIYNIIND